jgi:hypothetical protein
MTDAELDDLLRPRPDLAAVADLARRAGAVPALVSALREARRLLREMEYVGYQCAGTECNECGFEQPRWGAPSKHAAGCALAEAIR